MLRYFAVFVGFLTNYLAFYSHASSEIPDPLTLEQALSIAEEGHPGISVYEMQLEEAYSRRELVQSETGIDIGLQLRAQWVEPPPELLPRGREDHSAVLFASKPLWDFGRSSNRVIAAQSRHELEALRLQQAKQNHRLEVMRAFFNVILSDLQFTRDDEAMTVAYLDYDKLKRRQVLGQYSEIDVLEKEAEFQALREVRVRSASLRKETRAYLSLMLNRPNDLVSQVIFPQLDYSKLAIPEVEKIQKAVHENNLDLRIMEEQIKALRHELESIIAQRRPRLSAEVLGGVYEREIGRNDQWRASLVMDMPIYQGGKVGAESALKRSEIKKIEYQRQLLKAQLNQQGLEMIHGLEQLKARKQANEVNRSYRELYLDRARALYNMEVKVNLGDATAAMSEAMWASAKTDIEMAMQWETLLNLTQLRREELNQ